MKDKILSALKKGVVDPKTGKTSINDKTLNAYVDIISAQITDESQIEAAIAPHIAVLKEVQGNINSVAAEAAKEAKKEGKTPETVIPPAVTPPATDLTEMQKVLAGIQTLTNEVLTLKGEKVHETHSAKLIAQLAEKKVPESYYQPAITGRKFEKEEDVASMVEVISTGYTKLQQDMANQLGGVAPEGGKPPVENADVKAVADLINQGTKDINDQKK